MRRNRRRPVGSAAEDGDFGYGQAGLHEAVPDGAHLYRVDAHRVPNAHVPTEVLAEEFLLHRAGEQLREPAHEDADDGGSPEAHGILHRADDEDAAGEVHGRTRDRGHEEHGHAEDEEADDHHPGVEILHDRDHVSEEEHRALADAHVAHEIEDGDVARPSYDAGGVSAPQPREGPPSVSRKPLHLLILISAVRRKGEPILSRDDAHAEHEDERHDGHASTIIEPLAVAVRVSLQFARDFHTRDPFPKVVKPMMFTDNHRRVQKSTPNCRMSSPNPSPLRIC